MAVELTILTDWIALQTNINNYLTNDCFIELGYGKIPERLDNKEYLIIKSVEKELLDATLIPHLSQFIEHKETPEDEVEDENGPVYWAVIYPVSKDE